MACRFAGVSMVDGAIALTRMPSFTASSASATVSAATAALLAVYATMPAPARHSSAGRVATLMMRPPAPVRVMALTAARQQRKGVTKLGSLFCLRAAPREPARPRGVVIGEVADGARLEERAHHRGAERAGPPGDYDMAIA